MKHVLLTALATWTLGCGCAIADTAPGTGTQTYAKIQGEASASRRAIGLCELAQGFARGGGVYQVDSIVSTMEFADLAPGSTDTVVEQPFTFITFKSVAPWTPGAPVNPVARIRGGEFPNGSIQPWPVSLAVGEQVGLLFYDPYPLPTSNHGFLTVHQQGLFQLKANGGYSNTELFTASKKGLAEVGEMLSKLYAALSACPLDVAPDVGAVP